jgi:hypothetical protein
MNGIMYLCTVHGVRIQAGCMKKHDVAGIQAHVSIHELINQPLPART